MEEDTAVLVTKGREIEVLGNGIVMLLDGHQGTSTIIYKVEPGEVFPICGLHLLAKGSALPCRLWAGGSPHTLIPKLR